jgi:hypothetical protein
MVEAVGVLHLGGLPSEPTDIGNISMELLGQDRATVI